jgi:hypothetical protein
MKLLLLKTLTLFTSFLIHSCSVAVAGPAALNKKEQCYLDLENDPYAIEMNDIPLFEGASVVNNDRPAWTTLLMQFYYMAIATSGPEEEGDSFPTPYGLCIADAHGLMRCNGALVPYFLDLMMTPKNANYTTSVYPILFRTPNVLHDARWNACTYFLHYRLFSH